MSVIEDHEGIFKALSEYVFSAAYGSGYRYGDSVEGGKFTNYFIVERWIETQDHKNYRLTDLGWAKYWRTRYERLVESNKDEDSTP